jgi:chromosome segregation ATPase
MSQDFLNLFENSLLKLDELTELVENNVKERESFSSNLKTKLSEINDRLALFSNEINDLKNLVNNLMAKVKTNNGVITELRDELKNRLQNINDANQTTSQVVDMKAKEITNLNETIQKLQNEINDLKTSGDNNNKGLISQKETEIAELNQSINYLRNQGSDYYNQLEAAKKKLEDENERLNSKISAATKIINKATLAMENLLNAAPNLKTQQEVNSILASIESNLKSMEDINLELKKSSNNDNFNTIKKGSDDFAFGGRMTRKKRKRRKNKKQKGGFTYKINSKRKSITSHSNSLRKGSKSSSKRNTR